MASSAMGKGGNLFDKILPKFHGGSSLKKVGSSGKAKKNKKRELKLEAASVSQNFDPETYIIPLQNRWTFESYKQRSKIIGSHNDDNVNASATGSTDNLIFNSSNLNYKSQQSSGDEEQFQSVHIKQNPTFEHNLLLTKHSSSTKKETNGKRRQQNLPLDLDSIGYVPSHPVERQRSAEKNADVSSPPSSIPLSTQRPADLPSHRSDFGDDCYATARRLSRNNGLESPTRITDNPHQSINNTSSLPGAVPIQSDNQIFDATDLDIDRVELIAESDSGDDWSIGTPSLPPLSTTSSGESDHRDFVESSQSDISLSIVKNSTRVSSKKSPVAEMEGAISYEFLPKTTVSQLEEQREFMLKRFQITDRKEANLRRQRNKDMKLVDQRFTRLESHVITLARSVAHLSNELRLQNKIRQNVASLQKDVYELKTRRNNELKYLQERAQIVELDKISQKKIRKLRKFFGEDPGHPLLLKFLEEMGYEEYSRVFQKAKIGLMELPYLSEEQLKDIGIPSGPTSRIIENAKHLYK